MKNASPITRILIVEKDPGERGHISQRLETLGFVFKSAASESEAIQALRLAPFDLILSGPELPQETDLSLFIQFGHIAPGVPIIALRQEEAGIEAQDDRGAWEIIQSPVDLRELERAISRISTSVSFQQRIETLENQLSDSLAPPPIVGSSKAMIRLLEGLEDAAFSDRPTLLIGEAGSHRESIARALHDLSPQRSGAFVTLSCGSKKSVSTPSANAGLTESDFCDSLNRASRTASNGTLFLSDIERLSVQDQNEVFRLLELKEGRVCCR